jgi:hypothetical protein
MDGVLDLMEYDIVAQNKSMIQNREVYLLISMQKIKNKRVDLYLHMHEKYMEKCKNQNPQTGNSMD